MVSAPAGFGKTTLLSSWAQSLPADAPVVAWISLDEEDNDPRLFWAYVLAAFSSQRPERFTPLLKSLQSLASPTPEVRADSPDQSVSRESDHFVLILDDYQVITEPAGP